MKMLHVLLKHGYDNWFVIVAYLLELEPKLLMLSDFERLSPEVFSLKCFASFVTILFSTVSWLIYKNIFKSWINLWKIFIKMIF